MAVRTLMSCDGFACMYCSTTMWAFGPLFYGENGLDADDVCDKFIRWHFMNHGDPRMVTDPVLELHFKQFREEVMKIERE